MEVQNVEDENKLIVSLLDLCGCKNLVEIAPKCIKIWGGYNNLIMASKQSLILSKLFTKRTSTVLSLFKNIFYTLELQKFPVGTKLVTSEDFCNLVYCNCKYLTKENFFIVCISRLNKFESIQSFSTNECNKVSFLQINFIKTISNNTAKVLVFHNHPNGVVFPSRLDVENTQKIENICKNFNVIFCDHLIYARGKIFSFNQNKVIKE
ncbi:MAG: JAB domain-containing protein [Clostridia bacterium]